MRALLTSRWTLPGADRTPFATYLLVVANLVIFALMERAGGSQDPTVLDRFGALFGPLVAEGQYWRLLTAIFLHIGFVHIAFNSMGLFVFGTAFERTSGPLRMAAVYIGSGLAGSALSYLASPAVRSAGASGAIFGVLGALAVYLFVNRQEFGKLGQREITAVLFLAAMNLLTGLTTPGVDNWAHVGGLIGGAALALAIVPRHAMAGSALHSSWARWASQRRVAIPAALGLAVVAGALIATLTLPDNASSHVYTAERLYEEGDLVTALAELDIAVELDPLNGEAHLLRGQIHARMGNIEAALADLGIALTFGHPKTRDRALELIPEVGNNRGLNR